MQKTWINYFFSRIFGLDDGINLIPDGDNELVTIHNVEVNSISISTNLLNLMWNLLKNYSVEFQKFFSITRTIFSHIRSEQFR